MSNPIFVRPCCTVCSMSDCRSRVRKFESQLGHIIFVKIDHEIISTVILPLLLIQERQLLVNRLSMCIKYWAQLFKASCSIMTNLLTVVAKVFSNTYFDVFAAKNVCSFLQCISYSPFCSKKISMYLPYFKKEVLLSH